MAGLTRRDFLAGAAASLVAGPLLLAACRKRKRTLNVLNWAGYIDQGTLARFEQQTQIALNYEVYFDEAEMLSKLAAKTPFDVVVAPGYLVPRLKDAGLIAPLPHDRLPLMANIAKRFRDPAYDPGLAYSVPYLWGTTGLAFSAAHFPEKPDSWRALWDERCRGRITMLDDGREAVQCALLILGLPPGTGAPAHLDKVRELLLRQRPLLKEYSSTGYAEELAAGETWLAQAWSGDILQTPPGRGRADYTLPREGAFRWVDNLCLVEAGSSREEAVAFIDYLLHPEVAAGISDSVRYATPNEKALARVSPALRADPRAFPPPEVEARLLPNPVLDLAAEELWRRTWQAVRRA